MISMWVYFTTYWTGSVAHVFLLSYWLYFSNVLSNWFTIHYRRCVVILLHVLLIFSKPLSHLNVLLLKTQFTNVLTEIYNFNIVVNHGWISFVMINVYLSIANLLIDLQQWLRRSLIDFYLKVTDPSILYYIIL